MHMIHKEGARSLSTIFTSSPSQIRKNRGGGGGAPAIFFPAPLRGTWAGLRPTQKPKTLRKSALQSQIKTPNESLKNRSQGTEPPARSNNKFPTRLHREPRQYTNFGRQMARRNTRNGIRLFGGSSPRICVRPHEICLKNTHFLRVPLARDVLRALACFNNNL